PYINGGGGWGIFNAIFGWQNSATVGTVVSYNLFWLVVIIGFASMGYNEKKGHWPLMKNKKVTSRGRESESSYGDERDTYIAYPEKTAGRDGNVITDNAPFTRALADLENVPLLTSLVMWTSRSREYIKAEGSWRSMPLSAAQR
ncbi:MAG: hypothetical protein Q9184_007205, partial [Pyrenodesmia sp. 2 TL-2023]